MPEDYFYASSCYLANDIKVLFKCDSKAWADSMVSYLSLPLANKGDNLETVELTLHEGNLDKLEEKLPLPGEQYLEVERTLLVDRPVPVKSYAKDRQHWVDYGGLGRAYINYENRQACAMRLANCGISAVYSDIIFGYNLLLSLLAGFGYFSVHASCVQVNGKGIIFTGDSGSGKSTSSYAMLRRGHPVLADDRILLKKNGSYHALALSDVIKLKEEARKAFFPELEGKKPLHLVEDEFYYKVGAAGDYPYLNSTPLDYLVVFEKTGLAKTRLEKVNPARVIGDLFPVTLATHSPQAMEKKFGTLIEFLEKIKCYRAYFGTDMEHFAESIEGLVAENRLADGE